MPQTLARRPTPDRTAIRTFYDGFTRKLLRDYVQGNVRQSRAFELVRSAITPATRTILDVGCGIGASSASYVARRNELSVHGVDISPNNIRVATALFGSPQLRFSVSDMMSPPGGTYDLIALVDMHEHIPRASWPVFHDTIRRSLSETGTLVMTTPSPLHQEHLRLNKPERLQVVDETIEMSDVVHLARRLDAAIIRYEWVGIWHSNDYVYTVISRAPDFTAIPRRARWLSRPRPPILVSRVEDLARRLAAQVHRRGRALHVRRTLGVTLASLLLGTTEPPRIDDDPGHRAVYSGGQIDRFAWRDDTRIAL
jgi:2-polyprenyl-3-methyl-5-hydroxy-6-metoxy-1,4-benzoquinol methylase